RFISGRSGSTQPMSLNVTGVSRTLRVRSHWPAKSSKNRFDFRSESIRFTCGPRLARSLPAAATAVNSSSGRLSRGRYERGEGRGVGGGVVGRGRECGWKKYPGRGQYGGDRRGAPRLEVRPGGEFC